MDQAEVTSSMSPHPHGVPDLLSRIGWIMRGQWRTFLKMALGPVAAVVCVYAVLFGGMAAAGMLHPNPQTPPNPAQVLWMIPGFLVGYAVLLGAYALFEAAVTRAAVEANRGNRMSAGEAYALVRPHVLRMVGLMLMRFLYILLPCFAAGIAIGIGTILFRIGGNANPGWMFLLWPLLAVVIAGSFVWAVWMMLRLALAVPICVMEDAGVMQSMHRSAELTRGGKGRIFVVFLVVYLAGLAGIFAAEIAGLLLVGIGGGLGALLHAGKTLTMVAMGAGFAGFMALLLALIALQWASYGAAYAVLYDDQRLRLDGTAQPALTGGD